MLGYFYRKRFDLYYPIAHPDTRRISFTYVPVASMWVIALHNLFLYSDPPPPCHPPSYWLRLFSSQTFSYKYPNILNPSHSSYLSAYEDETDRVFRNVSIRGVVNKFSDWISRPRTERSYHTSR